MSSQARRSSSESSEEESDSGEEGTKVDVRQPEAPKRAGDDEEEEEEEDEEESDTDSDSEPGPQFNAVRKDVNSKAAAKVPPLPAPVAGKRGRDVNGGKGAPVQEPISKRRKESKDERARLQPVKPASPTKGEKGLKAEQATEGTKAAKADKGKVGKVENAKPQAASRKRKASPPPVNSVRQPPQKLEVEKSSPVKPKKTAQWTNTLEESLVSLLYKDKSNGFTIPYAKGDSYWEKLLKRLPLDEEITEVQLCEKVKRMKLRYQTLKERPKGEGGKLFKSQHEEKIFQIWEGIWGSGKEPATGRSIPSQAVDHEDKEDESAGTATRPELVSKVAGVQANEGDSSSEDENEEDEPDIGKQTTAGMNQINAGGKRLPEQIVVTPFISKPRLEFTPLIPKAEKRKVLKKVEEVTSGDQHTGDVLAGDDGRKGDVSTVTSELLKQCRTDMYGFFNEFRSNCLQLLEEVRGDRLGSLGGGAGNFAIAGKGFGNFGMPEGLLIGNGSQAALELQKKWRKYKIQELALLSERLQLLQEQCRLQQEELRLQNEKLEQQEN